MDLQYKIIFHTDWHCGSGLAAGADVDSLVIKDRSNLPYVPGKTVKGLVKEALEDLAAFRGLCQEEKADLDMMLGTEGELAGTLFFTNAQISDFERETILAHNVSKHMYRVVSSTKIGEDGTAEEHSLRRIQVVVPCTLEGEILNVPEGKLPLLKDALRYIKRLGQNRNRGLGRCTFVIE